MNDPRWTRPLPWTTGRIGMLGVKDVFYSTGLAVLNVAVPLAIVRLAARRRGRWTMRTLMALPVAAAVPLTALTVLLPQLQAGSNPWFASAKLEFLFATIVGVPFLAIVSAVFVALVRRRWKWLGSLIGLVLLSSIVTAGAWLCYDMMAMPAIEHFSTSGWYLSLVSGAGAAGVAVAIGWLSRGFVSSRRRASSRVAQGRLCRRLAEYRRLDFVEYRVKVLAERPFDQRFSAD